MRTFIRTLGAAALVSAAFLGGTANAGCVAPDVCYGNVTVYEECVYLTGPTCRQVTVQAPLCFGGSMWTAGLCRF